MARRTKAEAQATRDSLLDVAEQLFQARGVSRTSLNDIAVAAGTTRGAIYWHFKHKADLFNAMMERVTLPLEQTLDNAQLAPSGDPVADIRHALLEALRLIATDEQTRRVLYIATHQIEYTDELGDVQTRRLQVHSQCVTRNRAVLAQALAAQGVVCPIPLDCAAHGLQALVEGLAQHWLLQPGAFDLVDTGRHTLDAYLRGLGLCVPAAGVRFDKLAPHAFFTPPKPAPRSHWLLASLMAGLASLLAACKSAPEAPLPGSQWPPGFVASPPSQASTARAYRQDAAKHLYALNAPRIYQGKLPASLYAIGVLEADIDPRGHVTRLKWKRAPQHAPEVIAEIERTVRAAAPFPLPAQLGRVTYTETWLWDKQGKFQLDTLTEGQL